VEKTTGMENNLGKVENPTNNKVSNVNKVLINTNHSDKTAKSLLEAFCRAGNVDKEEGEIVVLNLNIDEDKPLVNIMGPNGYVLRGLADSGAMRSCINVKDMELLGLRKNNNTVKIKGVTGVDIAYGVDKVKVHINGIEMELNAITIDNPSVPTLIGQPELRVLGFNGYVLDLRNMEINRNVVPNGHNLNNPEIMLARTLQVYNSFDNSDTYVPLMQLTEIAEDRCHNVWKDDFCVWHIDEYQIIKEKVNGVQQDIEIEYNPMDYEIPDTHGESDSDAPKENSNGNDIDRVAEAFDLLNKKIAKVAKRNTVSGVSKEEKDKILEKKISHLGDDLKEKVRDLFIECEDVWREPQTGRMESEAHFTVKGKPIVMKQRPMTDSMLKEFKKQIDELLSKGVIQPSKSSFGAVPVFVKKPDDTWRLCFDYRRLNKSMVFDAYPIPRIWDMVKSLIGYKVYSLLDANWGFWNLKLSDESKPFTAFISPWGLYEWTVLPFGIKNSPGEFQRAMDFALRDVKDFVNIYIDDMCFGTLDEEEHLNKLRRLLLACRKGGVYIKIAKVELFQKEVKVLGYHVNEKGVKPDPKKVKAIKSLESPKSVKEIRAFVGAIQFLGRFFLLTDKLAPLTELTKKYSRFEWLDYHQKCFDEAKEMLTEKMLLAKYNEDLPVGLACDASDIGIGGCLFQVENDIMKPLEFYSRKLTDAERKYPVREKEFLAIKGCLSNFNEICKATHTYVFTDHQSLEWLETAMSGRIQRWALFLQQYSVSLIYVPGKHNVLADWLSRSPVVDEDEIDYEIEKIAVPNDIASIFSMFDLPDSEKIRESLNNGWWKVLKNEPTVVPTLSMFKEAYEEEVDSRPEDVVLCSDGLYRYRARGRNSEISNRIYVPPTLREQVLFWFHASIEGGHRGVNRKNARMRKLFCWPGMVKDIKKFISACPCQRILKLSNQTFRSIKGVLECPRPLELVSIDFIGPKNWNGKSWYISCIVDHATRFMFNVVSHGGGSKDAILSIKQWCAVFGAPNSILHDNGPAFESDDFKQFVLSRLRVRNIRCSPYYPQGNAINESSHQNLHNMISSQGICATSEEFPEVVRVITMCYNATPHQNLGASPYYAMFGTEMLFPGWQKLTSHGSQSDKFANLLKVRLEAVMRSRVRELQELKVPEGDKFSDVKEGDWCWYKLGDYEKNCHYGSANITDTIKLQPRWSLPCKVVEIKKGQVLVQALGSPNEPYRRVPKMQLRVIPTNIPKSLAHLNIKNIIKDAPRIPVEHRRIIPRGDVSMDNVMNLARKERESRKQKSLNVMFVDLTIEESDLNIQEY